MGASGVFALAVDGIEVKNNRFENCSRNPYNDDIESRKYDIGLMNCKKVVVEGNTSSRDEKLHIHLTNIEM